MNRTFKLVVVAAIAGSSRFALAASSGAASFADAFAGMQALSSNSSQWQPAQRAPAGTTVARHEPLSIRDYQALSSNSSQWQFDQGVSIDRGPTFAQTHPHGIPFADYQALSANSDQYGPSANAASSMAMSDGVATTAGSGATLRQRLTGWFRGRAPASMQDD